MPPAPSSHRPTRRDLARWLGALVAGACLPAGLKAAPAGRFAPARAFSPAALVAQARAAARRPYAARPLSAHAAVDFDAHVRLAYGAAEEMPGHIRLFPTRRDIGAGSVDIHLVEGGMARQLIDTHGLFGSGEAADAAGFRAMYADGHADWLAFLGASYFRAVGGSEQYGLSARGVAVNTSLPGREEFPAFTAFWLEPLGEQRFNVHALLDGPSLTGAFSIATAREQGRTVQDVTASLFFRQDIAQLGLAPMTSMFFLGESTTDHTRDWRPEVHDSDGLAIHMAGGERIWRPLDNPPEPRTHSFRADAPRGFGLLQRDRAFDHYLDDQSFFDRRPSLWVEPKGHWGKGQVVLYAFPTASENVDNVAAFWQADAPARAGGRRDLAYRLTWSGWAPADANACCVDVHQGPGGVPGAEPIAGATRYVFDFAGPVLAGISSASAITDLPKEAVLLSHVAPVAGQPARWRVTLDVRTQGLAQADFRLFLAHGPQALSETVIQPVRA
ncbi:MAG TPA: glucan biosynthesis protein [Novosphingobium sp.]|nr:glucan biosynthesis protein [Novosphingobium sp.]